MERIHQIVETIAAKQAIVDYTHRYSDDDKIGEGNFGSIQNFVISGVKSGEPITLNIFVKFPPSNEFLRQEGVIEWMFTREIFLYEQILPLYSKIDGEFAAPACYYTCAEVPNELIALQDMRYSGYQLYRECLFFDLDHVEVSIRSLARFHALSIALKHSDPVKYGECVENCSRYFDIDTSLSIKRRFRGILQQTSKEIGGEIGNILKDIAEVDEDVFKFNPKIEVLCHGDTWKNNILFKYEDERPVSACLVDFQFAHVGGAALDLVYLIATSTDSFLRSDHFEHLVQTYRDTVVNVLIKVGTPSPKVDECFSYCDLIEDMKLAGRACLSIANHSFRNWLGMDSVSELDSDTFIAYRPNEKVIDKEIREKFNNIIKDLVTDFKKNELI